MIFPVTVVQSPKLEVSRGWISRFGLMYLGQNIAWAAPTNLLLSAQILVWFPEDKERQLALLMTAGGLVSLLASPLAGIFSDRTRSSLGRRTPWIIAGITISSVALGVAGWTATLPGDSRSLGYGLLLAAWMVFQFAIALAVTPTQSIVPDQVTERQFGTVSGVMGMTYTLGIVLGTALSVALPRPWAYAAVIVVLLATAVPFFTRDREPLPWLAGSGDPESGLETSPAASPAHGAEPAAKQPEAGATGTTPTGLAAARRVVPNPKDAPDFYWMFLTRLLLMLAQAIALFFLLYYLRDRIGFHDPELGVLILTAVFAGCVVATALWSGWFSDKLGVRKPFILFSATGVAGACAVLAFTSSFTMVVVGAVILGLSWGVYQAIDQALVNAVLPTEQERATHMGLINLAVLLPNTLAPSIAAIALSLLGGYTGLYLLAGAMCLAGGVLVLKIQATR
ncbi:MFS transporter permease [Corynebacterium sp. HMSC22B11]|nr:MFS transporter permease [Corynebacterium sp. HMSC22B11]